MGRPQDFTQLGGHVQRLVEQLPSFAFLRQIGYVLVVPQVHLGHLLLGVNSLGRNGRPCFIHAFKYSVGSSVLRQLMLRTGCLRSIVGRSQVGVSCNANMVNCLLLELHVSALPRIVGSLIEVNESRRIHLLVWELTAAVT